MDLVPHSRLNCRITFLSVVAAIISAFGINFAIALVVAPLVVAVIIAFADKSLAIVEELLPIAFVIVNEF